MTKPYKFALFLLMFNMFVTMSGIGLLVPVMPAYLEMFNASGQVLGFLVASVALAQFIFSPISGNLSDRFGRKNLILFGLLVYGVAQILFSISTVIWLLFVARFLAGIGAAFIVPPIMAYVADITTPEQRGKAMGFIGAAISFGFMIGPAIGGALSTINLHFPFYVAGTAAFIACILSYFVLPQTAPTYNPAVKTSNNIFVQMRSSFKKPYFVLLIVVFIFSFGIANFQATMAIFVTEKFNYTPTDISIILTVGGFVGVIVQSLFLDRLFKYFGQMKIILGSLILAAIAMLCMTFVSGYFLIIFVATIFQTATTLIRPAANTLISLNAQSEQGFAAGMNNAYMSLGNIFGPALAGTLLDWHLNSPHILGSSVLLFCFVLTYFWQVKSKGALKVLKTVKETEIQDSSKQ